MCLFLAHSEAPSYFCAIDSVVGNVNFWSSSANATLMVQYVQVVPRMRCAYIQR